jgi:organic hydroperoxide reductase OsmC/OhrA
METMETVKSALRPIDLKGLTALTDKNKADPAGGKKTLKATTIAEGQFRNLTYVRDLAPVVIDEPPHLLGQDTAPNPSEAVLCALGACLAVGYMANASFHGIELTEIKIEMEADIDISSVWGLGDVPSGKHVGFSAVRVKAHIAGTAQDGSAATRDKLNEIVQNANDWSPVAGTLRNPVPVTAELI